MWKMKVKTWGYTDGVFQPTEIELTVKDDEEMVRTMKLLQRCCKHEVTFVISKEPEGEEEFK